MNPQCLAHAGAEPFRLYHHCHKRPDVFYHGPLAHILQRFNSRFAGPGFPGCRFKLICQWVSDELGIFTGFHYGGVYAESGLYTDRQQVKDVREGMEYFGLAVLYSAIQPYARQQEPGYGEYHCIKQ